MAPPGADESRCLPRQNRRRHRHRRHCRAQVTNVADERHDPEQFVERRRIEGFVSNEDAAPRIIGRGRNKSSQREVGG